MAKQKFSIQSLQVKNMNCAEYMLVHNRMYILSSSNDNFYICLHQDRVDAVKIPITMNAFQEFISFEMEFGVMLNLFAALCMRAGSLPF